MSWLGFGGKKAGAVEQPDESDAISASAEISAEVTGDFFDEEEAAGDSVPAAQAGVTKTSMSKLDVTFTPVQHAPTAHKTLQAVRNVLSTDYPAQLQQSGDWVDTHCIERYLRAEKGNVQIAAKRIASTIQWREKIKPHEIRCSACDVDHRSHDARFIGFDRHGRPCIYSCFAASTAREPKALLSHFLMLLEQCCQKMTPPVQTLVWIVDFHGFSVRDAMDPRFSINLVTMLQAHFPERMAHIVCLSAPTAFKTLW